MKTYYQDDYCTIYHADAIDIIDELGRFELTLTDPPYGINGGTGGTSKKRARGNYDSPFEDTQDYITSVCVKIIKKCIEISDAVILTPGNKNCCSYPQPNSFGCLYQPQAGGMQRWGWADSQPVFYYGISPMQGKKASPCSFISNKNDDCNYDHPCPKPYSIWSKLYKKGILDSGAVLDPFMGTGTTLRIAKDNNNKAVGIELSEKYCEIAAKRLSQEVFDFETAQ